MDYKIKFEYKGIGKQASAGRQRALSAQRGAERSQGATAIGGNRELVSSIRSLNSSIMKLIASNKELSRSVKTGGGGGGGLPGGGGGGGGGASVGRIGSSMPLGLGIAAALTGFAIQKANQIGRAYMETASRQIGNVGTGGFRYGKGVYTADQMGAGMGAYAKATGRFAPAESVKPDQGVLDIGAMYGMSAQDVLQKAGTFKRAGGSMTRTAYQGVAGGIESELPMLLTGVASMMEEAIKNGVNTSDLSKDLGKEISVLAEQTPAKSVEAAMNIIKTYSRVKDQVSRGQVGSYEGLMTAKSSQNLLMDKVTGSLTGAYEYAKSGVISNEQAKKINELGPNATYSDLQQKIGPVASLSLLQARAEEAKPTEMLSGMMKQSQERYGKSPEARQRAYQVYRQQGGSLSRSQYQAAWQATSEGREITDDMISEGKKKVTKGAKAVKEGKAGMAVTSINQRTELLLEHGKSFADTALEMETAMISLTKDSIKGAATGITELGDAATSAASKIKEEMSEKFLDKEGKVSWTKVGKEVGKGILTATGFGNLANLFDNK